MADDQNDPLARFRTPGAKPAPAAAPKPETSPDAYEAFKPVTRRQVRLKIRPEPPKVWERHTYSTLHRIVEDADRGTQAALIFTYAVVVINGRNLQDVFEAIGDENCEWIQAFDPLKWAAPSDESKPFIESIDIYPGDPKERLEAIQSVTG